mgnify:CR=1 FL=1
MILREGNAWMSRLLAWIHRRYSFSINSGAFSDDKISTVMTINPNKKTKNNRNKRIFLRWFRANTGAPDGRFWCLWCYPCAKITDFSKSHFSVLKSCILNSPGIRLEIASRLIQWRLKTWMSVIYFAGLCLSRVSLWSSNDHFETANHRSARKYICGRGIMNFRFNRGRDLREVGPVVEGDQDSPTRLTQSSSSRRRPHNGLFDHICLATEHHFPVFWPSWGILY